MLKDLLAAFLRRVADDVQSGNCNMTEAEMAEVFDHVQRLTDSNGLLTKYEACKYLHVSRATFDRLISEGKLPKGRTKAGTASLFWAKKDLHL